MTGAGAGVGVRFFGAGADSESKNLDSDHLCSGCGISKLLSVLSKEKSDESFCANCQSRGQWCNAKCLGKLSTEHTENR